LASEIEVDQLLESVAELDGKRGVKKTDDDKAVFNFSIVELNVINRKTLFMPVSLMEKIWRELKVAHDI
jgi:hypothetical protein